MGIRLNGATTDRLQEANSRKLLRKLTRAVESLRRDRVVIGREEWAGGAIRRTSNQAADLPSELKLARLIGRFSVRRQLQRQAPQLH